MAGQEPSEAFYDKLDNFIGLSSKKYFNANYDEEIRKFTEADDSWFSRGKNTRDRLKENFKKPEVREEFDTLLTAIFGDCVKGGSSLSSSTSSGSIGGSQTQLNQSKFRLFITDRRVPKHVIRGREYEFKFKFILDGKETLNFYDLSQLGGDKINYLERKTDSSKARPVKVLVPGKEISISFTAKFDKGNNSGLYSFAFIDKDGNSMHADKPIQKDITVIDEPIRPQKSNPTFKTKITDYVKKGKSVSVTLLLSNQHVRGTKECHIEMLENESTKVSPPKIRVDKSVSNTLDFNFSLKDEMCDFLFFTIVDEEGKDIIDSPIEIHFDKEEMCESIYVHSLPEIPRCGEEVTGVLSIRNDGASTIYSSWKLENSNKTQLVTGIKVSNIIGINKNERKNFLIKFKITEKPKGKPPYTLQFKISDYYSKLIGNFKIQFKDIEDRPAQEQDESKEIQPKQLSIKSMHYTGKITGSWKSSENIVKDMAFEVKFRVQNKGSYEWPGDIKVFFVSGSPIYGFSFDTSGLSKLPVGKDGNVIVRFKIKSQINPEYKFDLAIKSNSYGNSQFESILSEPLKFNLELKGKLGAYFTGDVAPQSESSKKDRQYTFHELDDIKSILGIKKV